MGIVQEQHGERAALFAQWKGLEGTLAVDALNQLGVTLVPITIAIDEWGVVRSVVPRNADPADFVETFLSESFEKPAESPKLTVAEKKQKAWDRANREGLTRKDKNRKRIEFLEQHLAKNRKDATSWFQLGVLYRARFDMEQGQVEDFRRAVEAWEQALQLNPNQYIWRRRIQQYGPRLTKPYPFYDWVEEATTDLGVELKIPLTRSELSSKAEDSNQNESMTLPVAAERVMKDEKYVAVHSVVVPATEPSKSAFRVYLSFDVNRSEDAHWNHEARGLQVWWDLPEGVEIEGNFTDPPRTDVATSEERRVFEFEIEKPTSDPLTLNGKAFYYICLGEDGECLFRMQPLKLKL